MGACGVALEPYVTCVRREAPPRGRPCRIGVMGTPPAPPAPLPTAEEERVKRRSRRAVLVVVAVLVAAGIAALAFVGVSVYSLFDLGRSWPQPDAPLVSRFRSHRAEFQELLLLAWADDGRGPDGRRVRAGVKKAPVSTPAKGGAIGS